MVMIKDLTQLTLKDLWKEVKEEHWWRDLKQDVVRALKGFLETTMEVDIVNNFRLQAGKHRRTELRRGYRNGYRCRSLLTEFGLVECLKIPRDRDEHYQPAVLARYQHRWQEVNRVW